MKRYIASLIAAAAALLLVASTGGAQMAGHDHAAATADQHATTMTMMANMQAEQKKLDELVAQMNAAKGPEKVDRIAAVVTEMAAMHKRMNEMMMRSDMMQMPHNPPHTPDAK